MFQQILPLFCLNIPTVGGSSRVFSTAMRTEVSNGARTATQMSRFGAFPWPLMGMVFALVVMPWAVSAQSFAIVGSGTGSNTTTGYPAPFGNYYWGARHQFLITAAQLSAVGVSAGSDISQMGFNVINWNSASTHNGFQIKVFTTTAANPISAGWVTTGLVAQTTAANVASGTGWRMFTFNSSFTWNGTDNLVVETCFQNGSWSSNASTQWTTNLSGATYSRWRRADATGVCSNTESTATSTTNRPNIRIAFTGVSNYRVQYNSINFGSATWCPGDTRNVTFNVTNAGTQPWTSGWTVPNTVNFSWWWSSQDQDSNPRVLPYSNLAPGASQDVTVSVTAPIAPGTYTIHSDMVRDGVCWFRNNQSPSCGQGNSLFVSGNITVAGPLTQPVFSASPTIIPQGIPATYTVTNVAGHSYNWSVPAGWTINSGQGTNSISVTPNGTSGSVSVTSSLCSSTSSATSVSVCVASGDQTTYGNGQWIGYVYQHANANQPSPAFQNSQYRGFQTQPEVFDQDWGTGSISGPNICGSYADRFHVRYRMTKSFEAGWYVFTMGGDDGVRLSVNGGSTYLISNWSNHGYQTTTSAPTYLSGLVNLMLEYYEDGSGARVSFDYGITMASTNTSYTISTCGGTFYDTGGPVDNYTNSQNRTITFYPSNPGDVVQLSFSEFVLESTTCGNDYDRLFIHDGNSTAATALHPTSNGGGFWTGCAANSMSLPTTFTSTAADGSLTVRFKSDGGVTAAGWTATVSCMTLVPCTGTPNAGTVSISSSSGCPSTNFTLSGSGFTTGQSGIIYQWQSSPSGAEPWADITGANDPATLVTSAAATTHYRLHVICSNTGLSHSSNVVNYSAVEPSVFGENFWYVYCYNGNNFETYRGYYTENMMSFDTHTRWGRDASPSSANALTGNGYVACGGNVNTDNHSYAYKRRGFPAGTYTISVNRDDDSQLLVNGVSVHNTSGWSYIANVWTGVLDPSSEVEFRVREFTGGSYGGVTFNEVRVPYSGNNTVPCGTDFTLLDHAGISQNGGAGVYADNAEGYTVIEAGVGATISLSGVHNTENCCDWVRVYDGDGIAGTQLASYQGGSWGAFSFTGSPGQTVSVRFRSDGSIIGEGFQMDVSYSGVCYPLPTISGFTPAGACPTAGGSVVITGTNFYLVSSVTFNGAPAASFTVNSPTQVTALVPVGFTTGPIAVTTAAGTATSATDHLLYPVPVVDTHPVNVSVCEEAATSFTATASGFNNYQWQYSPTPANPASWGITDGAAGVSGHQTPTLSLTAVPAAYSGLYVRCVITNGQGCSATTATAMLTVDPAPFIIDQPLSISLCPNGQSSINVNAGGAGPLTYQWFKDLAPMLDAAPYSGTETTNLQIDFPAVTEDNSAFQVVVSGACGSPVVSDIAILTMAGAGEALPPNPASASSYVICNGESIVLNATSPGYTMHWFTQASGGTAFTTSPSAVNTGNVTPTANTTYYVEAHLGGCISTRREVGTVFIIPNDPPQVSYAPPIQICEPGQVTLTSSACTPGTIQWYDDPSGCVPIHVGSPFEPTVAGNTTFYTNVTTNVQVANATYSSNLLDNTFNGLAGQMFDVQAAPGKTIEITGIEVPRYYTTNQTVRVYYKQESLQIPGSYPAGTLNGIAASWIRVHNGTWNGSGWLDFNEGRIVVPSGCRFAVYVFFPVYYRGNSSAADDRSNSDLTVFGTGLGAAAATGEFNMGAAAARGFRGSLRYDVKFVSPMLSVPVSVNNNVPVLPILGEGPICVGATVDLDLDLSALPNGGNANSLNGYRIHTFNTNGSLTIPAALGTVSAEVLVVGGGGGGGGGRGGGGGGGGVVYTSTGISGVSGVVVGGGGAAATNGSNSSFGSLVAIGGGRGGSHLSNDNGAAGGSGGGAAMNYDANIWSGGNAQQPGSASGGAGQPGGGSDNAGINNPRNTGGGGGAGTAGVRGQSTNVRPQGGQGIAIDLSGFTAFYGGGGGGARGGTDVSSAGAGTGGIGGGGTGGGDYTQSEGSPNTGGGGGGSEGTGSTGGSGVVIVRYPDPTQGSWSSSNAGVAWVNPATGVVTGQAAGTANNPSR